MIHQYKNNGYNIVLDINSGSVHVVDETVYGLLPQVAVLIEQGITGRDDIIGAIKLLLDHVEDREGSAVISSAMEEIMDLYEEGLLFTGDTYEQYIDQYRQRPTVVKALCLHIAHDCNLACRYCFAEEGEYHGRRAMMDLETGKKALDFLVAHSGDRVNLEVDFFGGEPLMNWSVVKELVAYGRSLEAPNRKKFRFTLTTNGVLLSDEMMGFINAEMNNLVLSIDGRKAVNDRMRPHRGGQGSYDEILPKFQKAAASRDQNGYYVRGTFTGHNLDFAEDVLHLADCGFEQISVEPVVSAADGQTTAHDGERDYALCEEDLPVLFAEYDRLAQEMIRRDKAGNGFNFFHFMIDMTGGPCVAKRLSGCGAGSEYLAVTPWGDFYPCHQFVGREGFLMGNVTEGITNRAIGEEFKALNVYTKPACRTCFARFYCSGGCAANSHSIHGRIDDIYELGCQLQRKRVECAIMIKAALAE
ncbi:MAG: thioether cross-link-forming SCIFF peptide maturase [Lachnospiraceae bacterium]|nr:thioether cross-link-forming SCIFF peptide maturase [Lachnospiraceae bacterium]